MSWKKFLLIAVAVGAMAFVSAPKSEARSHVGIGIGFPIGYYGAIPTVGTYPYGYGYPYGYYGPYYGGFGYRPYVYSRPVVVVRNGHHVVHHHHPH